MIRNLELSASLPPSREGRGARDGVNDGSCLYDEASIKISKLWGSGRFLVSEHGEGLGERAWKLCAPSHISRPMPPFIWRFICILYHTLYNKAISSKETVSLSSVSCSNKLIKPKEGVMRPPISSQLVRSTGDNLDLSLASVGRGSLVGPSL